LFPFACFCTPFTDKRRTSGPEGRKKHKAGRTG
jgi:hypothetical protein